MRPFRLSGDGSGLSQFKGAALPGVAPFSFYDLPAMILHAAPRFAPIAHDAGGAAGCQTRRALWLDVR